MAANNPILEAAEEGGEPSKQRKLGSKVNEIENSLEKRKKSLDWELSLQVAEKGASILSSFLSDTICSSMRPPPALSPRPPPLSLLPWLSLFLASLLSFAGIDGLLAAGELVPIVEKIAALMIIIKEVAKGIVKTVRDARQKVGR